MSAWKRIENTLIADLPIGEPVLFREDYDHSVPYCGVILLEDDGFEDDGWIWFADVDEYSYYTHSDFKSERERMRMTPLRPPDEFALIPE